MNKMIVSTSPHVHSGASTRGIMLDVVIALIPAIVTGIWVFGWQAALMVAVCAAGCVVFELGYEKMVKRPVTVGDLSAVVTGVLLALNLPVNLPIWQALLGCLVAIVVVKQLFGGLGYNFANPAITARVVLLICFASSMTNWVSVDLAAGATPLKLMADGTTELLPSVTNMLLGKHSGSLGETGSLALIVGGIYLIVRRVITWHTPVCFIGTVFLFTLIVKGDVNTALYHVLSGGLMIGAIFMATDYVTTPFTSWGRVIFGIGCGLITVLIRLWGGYPEGVSFAILLMNILTPYINRMTAPKPLGGAK